MKTKLLYILVSTPEDVYLEQAYVSVASARRRNPGAHIALLTDTATEGSFGKRGPEDVAFRALFDEVVVAPLDPSLPAMKRSRLLKTGMRQYVKGDFLFIDADTVVMRSLEDIDSVDASLAACRDLHAPFPEHPHRRATINMCKRFGFDVQADRKQVLAGQENYLKGQAVGIKPDQPSFAQTDAALGFPVQQLPGEWNCQAQNGIRYLRNAYILHYMVTNVSSGEEEKLYSLNGKDLLLQVREKGLKPVEEIIEDPMKGYALSVRVFAGEDLYFFQSRRYKWLRRRFRSGKFSIHEWLLKVNDHLLNYFR